MHESICETDENGDKTWYLNGVFHRTGGPAVEKTGPYGYMAWYLNRRRHRIDGPAVELANGTKEWYLHGTEYTFDKFIIKANWTTEEIAIWKLQYA
jgi:hypothetical protein